LCTPLWTSSLGDSLEVFVRREDERFIEEARRDKPELAEQLWIEERDLHDFQSG
jgi:hypothetical protein